MIANPHFQICRESVGIRLHFNFCGQVIPHFYSSGDKRGLADTRCIMACVTNSTGHCGSCFAMYGLEMASWMYFGSPVCLVL